MRNRILRTLAIVCIASLISLVGAVIFKRGSLTQTKHVSSPLALRGTMKDGIQTSGSAAGWGSVLGVWYRDNPYAYNVQDLGRYRIMSVLNPEYIDFAIFENAVIGDLRILDIRQELRVNACDQLDIPLPLEDIVSFEILGRTTQITCRELLDTQLLPNQVRALKMMASLERLHISIEPETYDPELIHAVSELIEDKEIKLVGLHQIRANPCDLSLSESLEDFNATFPRDFHSSAFPAPIRSLYENTKPINRSYRDEIRIVETDDPDQLSFFVYGEDAINRVRKRQESYCE